MDFSVLMSVYNKEKGDNLNQSLESILIKQSVIPKEVILVKDGPLNGELEAVISKYLKNFPNVLKLVEIPVNVGLGEALNVGLNHCNYPYVARMDSDDICAFTRFELQTDYLKINPDIDLVGSNILEFFESPDKPVFIKKMPVSSKGIKELQKRRNPINHVTVMFKKNAVLKAGGYLHLPYLEDYYLWVRMSDINCNLTNIDEELVFVRTGNEMFKRRGNKEYIYSWYNLQKVMKNKNQISYLDFIINMINIIVFIYIPAKLKSKIYKYLLRKNVL
ncbi:glycosyltransferase [Marinilactibacillus psychrotolerans]|uniref:glycosyltransferase n=1 Tax=Marinilactibacillus psychrotolerans TaxID=191770 RepID=UPI00382CDF59